MADKQNTKNTNSEKEKTKIWVGDDGIVRARIGKPLLEKDIWKFFEDVKETMARTPGKGKLLADISNAGIIRSSQFRKKAAERYKKLARDPGYEKIAVFGGNVLTKTIASFILAASGIKKMKIFNTEKEALKWLKQP